MKILLIARGKEDKVFEVIENLKSKGLEVDYLPYMDDLGFFKANKIFKENIKEKLKNNTYALVNLHEPYYTATPIMAVSLKTPIIVNLYKSDFITKDNFILKNMRRFNLGLAVESNKTIIEDESTKKSLENYFKGEVSVKDLEVDATGIKSVLGMVGLSND